MWVWWLVDSWTWGRSWTCSIPIPLSPYFFHLSHPYTSCNLKKFFWCACMFTTKKEHAMYIIALLLVATNIQNCAVRKNLWHWLHSPPPPKKKQATTKSSPASATLYSSLIKSNLWHETISQWAWQFFQDTSRNRQACCHSLYCSYILWSVCTCTC